MPLADELSHYASIVSWKVKQQTQILHIQAQIHELESQIGIQKTMLADRTYEMYTEGSLTVEPIQQICEKITALIARKAEHQQELEALRSQTPPEKPPSAEASAEDAAPAQAQEAAGEWVAPENLSEAAPPGAPVETRGEWVEPFINPTNPQEPPTQE
ncbi:MAG: hypothetical protein AAGU04_00090 [Anaerolineaceae bacterium]